MNICPICIGMECAQNMVSLGGEFCERHRPTTYRLGFGVIPMGGDERSFGLAVNIRPSPWVMIEFWKWDIRFGWIPQ